MMEQKGLSIKNQLKISIVIIVTIVILLALLSGYQANRLNDQLVTMYEHPLQVRRAISNVNSEIELMHSDLQNMILLEGDTNRETKQREIFANQAQCVLNIELLDEKYLGPRENIENLKTTFALWESIVNQTMEKVNRGEVIAAQDELLPESDLETYRLQLLLSIKAIDDFSREKADELYKNSQNLHDSTIMILIQVVALMLLVTFIIYSILYKNINAPLSELGGISKTVKRGDYSVRSTFKKRNEFGELAKQMNEMLENIETHSNMVEKSADLTGYMMSAVDVESFFEQLLTGLLKHVNGQFGGVYVLSEDKKNYSLVYSIGMGTNVQKSFDQESLEGELGFAVSSKEVKLIADIPDNASVTFPASSGTYKARELMTIPIMGTKNTIAVLTLGSINGFAPHSKELAENILEVITARTHGILAYREMKLLKEEMEGKNAELEIQQTELNNQSAELLEQNRELERQKEALSEASNLKTRFLSNMSHELRTPLNSIIALSGILQRKAKGQLPQDEYEYIDVISASGKNLLEMINDILDIAKIESGTVDLDCEIFNVNTLIAELYAIQKPLADQKHVELLHKNPEQEIFLNSDRLKLRQILQNLITNGVKFTDSGFVKIEAEKLGGNLIIKVSDTGIGIAKEHQTQIFEEFKQADSGTTRKYGGTGLGLSISKKYTQLLGGVLELDSVVGEGSIFTLCLPLVHTSAENLNPSSLKSAGKDNLNPQSLNEKAVKLLLIEDSLPAIIQIKDIFAQEGIALEVAENGEVAFKRLAAEIPDCIILDLMMPKIDGFEVLKQLRSDSRTEHVPVVILTAKYLTKEERSELKRNNIHQIIQKGNVDPLTLKETVLSAMAKPHKEGQCQSAVPTTKEQCQSAAPTTKEQCQNAVSTKPVILLVEDNANNRLTARALLKDDYVVIEAEDGHTGLRLAKEHTPDLILMDIALPDIDGVEVFKNIKKDPLLAHIPVIALTASAMQTDREIFLAHGFDAFIAKPILEGEFIKVIKEVIYGE
ncbi:MAG: response regulator [Clostridia bacterium]|nr:response regulator [Clostridia bacterium]